MITKNELKIYEIELEDVISYKKSINEFETLVSKYEIVIKNDNTIQNGSSKIESLKIDLDEKFKKFELILSVLN